MDPTDHPSIQPTSVPTTDPTTEPTRDPTNDPSVHPTVNPTNNPTMEPTIDPTNDPTTNPTKNPTFIPTQSTMNPSQYTNAPSSKPTVFESITISTSTMDTAVSSLSISAGLVGLIVVVSIFDFAVIVGVGYYISKYLVLRTKDPGNASVKAIFKEFSILEWIVLILEIFDIVTDLSFGASLIVSDNNEHLAGLGWVSLLFAAVGISVSFFKYITYRKLIGHQVNGLRKELKECEDETKRTEIVQEIRVRTMDMDVLSLMNGCIEDIPQTLIVLVAISGTKWGVISVLSITMSITSFLLKLSQVIGSKCGCKDTETEQQMKTEMMSNTVKVETVQSDRN
eukprot:233362_1